MIDFKNLIKQGTLIIDTLNRVWAVFGYMTRQLAYIFAAKETEVKKKLFKAENLHTERNLKKRSRGSNL